MFLSSRSSLTGIKHKTSSFPHIGDCIASDDFDIASVHFIHKFSINLFYAVSPSTEQMDSTELVDPSICHGFCQCISRFHFWPFCFCPSLVWICEQASNLLWQHQRLTGVSNFLAYSGKVRSDHFSLFQYEWGYATKSFALSSTPENGDASVLHYCEEETSWAIR